MRPIYEIAKDIRKDWPKPHFAARPYLEALLCIGNKGDAFGADSGASIVAYFLSNAATYRGDNARRLKAELRSHIK